MNAVFRLLRAAGSLWFAAVIMMLLLVAMACATVFESAHGTEQALAVFYKAWWFQALLGLLALNVLAAVVVRYPFNRRQVGFILTHASILVILGGALVTQYWGVEGQVGIAEGQTVQHFNARQDSLSMARSGTQAAAVVDLDTSVFSGFQPADKPAAPAVALNDVRVEIERYLPDTAELEQVVNDESNGQPAVEVALSPTGLDETAWVFAGGSQMLGGVAASFRQVADAQEWQQLTGPGPSSRPAQAAAVKVELQGETIQIPLEECTARAVPVGDTGYTIRVLHYFAHAIVGADHQIRNASDRPINPAVEVEISGPGGTFKRMAFARFPEFASSHGSQQLEGLKIAFLVGETAHGLETGATPIEVLSGPAGELYVRFSPSGGTPSGQALVPGTPVPSPWKGLSFAVLRKFDRARLERLIEPVSPVRKEREPAVRVRISAGEHTRTMWLQKYRAYPVNVNGASYSLVFADKQVPLGFNLKLDRFRVGYYPGERRPRSFESHITILDPATGREQSHVVSMNHPVKHGRYTLYQSSYRQNAGQSVSFLSVSCDPGQPVVFAGYSGLMLGMLLVLANRVAARRRQATRLTGSKDEERGSRISRLEPHAVTAGNGSNGHARRKARAPVMDRT